MKNIFLILLFVLVLVQFLSANESVEGVSNYKCYNKIYLIDTVREILNGLNIDDYVDKPADSIIAHLPTNYTRRFFTYVIPISNRVKYYVRSLVFKYRNGDKVEIIVNTHNYVNPIDPNKNWDLTLYKKENVHVISITGKNGYEKLAQGR
jgi:hypothetical protein